MTLSDDATERLADIVAMQPTKNKELMNRWGMESGSDVHQYLENELKEYYYRDESSLIRATAEAASLVDVEPGVEGGGEDALVIRVPPLQARIADLIAGPDDEPESVVGVLHRLQNAGVEDDLGDPLDVDTVRSGLRSLQDKGVVSVVQTTVPTFRLAVPRDELNVEVLDPQE